MMNNNKFNNDLPLSWAELRKDKEKLEKKEQFIYFIIELSLVATTIWIISIIIKLFAFLVMFNSS